MDRSVGGEGGHEDSIVLLSPPLIMPELALSPIMSWVDFLDVKYLNDVAISVVLLTERRSNNYPYNLHLNTITTTPRKCYSLRRGEIR